MTGSRRTAFLFLSLAALGLLGAHPAAASPRATVSVRPVPKGRVGRATPKARLWVRRYDGPANDVDAATALGVSPDGSKVFVTGQSTGSTSSQDYFTLAYDAPTGARLWAKRYNGPANDYDVATALAVSPDGSKVFVTGYSYGSGSSYDYATVAYEATTGAQLWVARYNGPASSFDVATGLGVSPDGSRVFVTGYRTGSTSLDDYATIAYDSSTGATLWMRPYNGPGNLSDDARALEISPDGSAVFVTGDSFGSNSSYDYTTIAYDALTGAALWHKRYDGPAKGDDIAYALGVAPDGSTVFVSGSSVGATSSDDYLTVAYEASTGARLWVRRFNGPGNILDDAVDLGVSPAGSSVFVTGYSAESPGFEDYVTVAYEASTGARLWVRRYDGPGNGSDVAQALGVSTDGSAVFVTGGSVDSTSLGDYATIAYDAATGATVWVRRYKGPANNNDEAYALAVSPSGGALYVTGVSIGSSGSSDYATVAYSTA